MKKIFILLTLLANLAGFAQSPNLTIHATIKDLKAGSVVYWRSISGTEKDSVKSAEGGFDIRTTIPEGEGNMYFIQIGTAYTEQSTMVLYLEKGKVEIRGEGPMFEKAKLSGSAFTQEFNAYNDFMDKDSLVASAKELNKKYRELYMNKDSIGMAKLRPQMEKADSVRIVLSKQWVQQHPSTPVSAYVLCYRLRGSMSFDELEIALGKLSPAAKDNQPAKDIAHRIAVNKLTGIGQTALDFTQEDTAGRPVSLKDFRGKYVLVDFWASWCHPCRMENPNVVKAFADYKDKNFTVLSISLDRPGQKEAWLKAIHEDHLDWTHVSDLKFWNNAVAKLYDIQSVPSNLLIGPDGKILAKDLHGEELEKKLTEILHG
ncbi:MAG TPA: TlpA disulfide reductase family protein [Puia sp.]|nr:TlpA disulfide reductase family protein [Puia sp.]